MNNVLKKNFSVVLVPDYLVKTMKSANIALDTLDQHLGNARTQDWMASDADRNKCSEMTETFRKKFSKNDLHDLIAANEVLYKYIIGEGYLDMAYGVNYFVGDYLKYGLGLWEKEGEVFIKSFINLYCDNKNKDTIIMNEDNKLFNYYITDNTVYVILHDGFTNFIVYNNLEFKNFFIFNLMSCLFKTFGEDTLYAHPLFKSFMNFIK